MVDNDLLHRFIFENAPVRGEFVRLEETFQTIINQHPYPPVIKRLLGEALCAVALLVAIIKFNGRLTIQFRGSGALKFFLAQCDNQFNVRGLAQWQEGMVNTEEELQTSLEKGTLAILLDSGVQKNRYQGIVAWRGQSLAESIEGYFRDSEQLNTRLWLTVDDHSAAGLMLQATPVSDENNPVVAIEKEIIDPHWNRLTAITSRIHPDEMLVLDHETLLRKIYPDEDVRVFNGVPVKFGCTCSRQKGEDAIRMLGKAEAEDELAGKQVLDVTCEFCNTKYTYDKVDVAKIFAGTPGAPPDTHLH